VRVVAVGISARVIVVISSARAALAVVLTVLTCHFGGVGVRLVAAQHHSRFSLAST